MKKLESSFTNMVVSLVVVATVVGSLLAWVNHITATPIRLQNEAALADGIKSVMGGEGISVVSDDTLMREINGKESLFIIHKTEDSEGRPSGAAIESSVGGFGGDMKVLVGFDVSGNISGYAILQHSETPGLGAKAETWFQRGGKGNIIGKNPAKDNLTVNKDGGDVDAITASTITSRAFLKAVIQAYDLYAETAASDNGQHAEPALTDGKTQASGHAHKPKSGRVEPK